MTLHTRLLASRICGSRALYLPTAARPFSSEAGSNGSTAPAQQGDAEMPSETIPPRWLADVRARIRKIRKTSPEKIDRAKGIWRMVNPQWLALLAAPDGFSATMSKAVDRRELIWGDMDSMVRHVNNLVYNRLAEAGRVNWVRRFAQGVENRKEVKAWEELVTPRSIGLILSSITTEFKFPLTYPDTVTVLFRVAERPDFNSDRLHLEAAIYSDTHRRLAARCTETSVIFNYQAQKKTTLPGFMVERFQDVYDEQLESKQKYTNEVLQVLRELRELEAAESAAPDSVDESAGAESVDAEKADPKSSD